MILSVVVTFLLAAVLTPLLAAGARRRGLLDVPNARSSHIVATPRTGGAAFVPAFLAGIEIANALGALTYEARIVVGSATALALLGLADDLRSLAAGARLLVQVAVACALVLVLDWQLLPSLLPGWIGVALTVLWIVACTNAYNFMDGIDGIAGGQAVAAGLGWAVLGLVIGSPHATTIGLLVTAAVGGFLIYNWAPAKVFMGDAGSAFLGFLFGAMPLTVGENWSGSIIWAALLVWPFLFDTGFTLIRRIRRREDIFTAHRSHLYQRLTIAGLSHSLVASVYLLLAFFGVAASTALAVDAAGALVFATSGMVVLAFVLWRYVTSREARIAAQSLPFSN